MWKGILLLRKSRKHWQYSYDIENLIEKLTEQFIGGLCFRSYDWGRKFASNSVKRFVCVGSCVLQKKKFLHSKSSRRWILQQNTPERVYSSIVFAPLQRINIFWAWTNASPSHTWFREIVAQRSPLVSDAILLKSLFAACLFSPCETLDQRENRVTFCSPESTPDAGIFFYGGHQNYPNKFFFISFCKQLTPQPTTQVQNKSVALLLKRKVLRIQAVVIKPILDCGRLGGDSRLVFDRRDVGMFSVRVWNSTDQYVVSKLEARCGMSTEMSTESSRYEWSIEDTKADFKQNCSSCCCSSARCRPVRINCAWRFGSWALFGIIEKTAKTDWWTTRHHRQISAWERPAAEVESWKGKGNLLFGEEVAGKPRKIEGAGGHVQTGSRQCFFSEELQKQAKKFCVLPVVKARWMSPSNKATSGARRERSIGTAIGGSYVKTDCQPVREDSGNRFGNVFWLSQLSLRLSLEAEVRRTTSTHLRGEWGEVWYNKQHHA